MGLNTGDAADALRSPTVEFEYSNLILLILNVLQKSGTVSRQEYVGSAYKKTMISGSDMDNLMIQRDYSIEATPSPVWGERALLRDADGNLLDPMKTFQTFKGKVQKAVNEQELAKKVKVAEHGPAVELRYDYKDIKFNVDLVFCYEIDDDVMYIAKPPKGAQGQDKFLWKYSTALDEKARMSTIDRGNTVSRWGVKILKGLIKSEPTLQVLTSYVIEQALYHIRDQHEKSFWKESNLKEIVRVLLEEVAEAVDRNELSNMFNPAEKNVIPQMKDITRSNVVNRLRRLAKEPKLQKLMETISKLFQ